MANMTTDNRDTQQKRQNFTIEQWRYIAASIENPQMSKRAIADYLGLSPDTVYGWTRNDKSIDEYIEQAVVNSVIAAQDALMQSLMKATLVKMSGLDSDNEEMRQKVASEILDRVLGKASQRTEITGANGGAIQSETTHKFDPTTMTDDELKRLLKE